MTAPGSKQHLRVAVDGFLISRQGKGVSRFLVSLLHAFAAMKGPEIELSVFLNKNAELPLLPSGHRHIEYIPVKPMKLILWEQWGFPRWARRRNAGLALVLSDRLALAPMGGQLNYLTYLFEVPDTRIEMNKKSAGLYQRLSDKITQWVFPRSVKKSQHIATSSFATRCDLISKYGVTPAKISVVYPAPDPMFVPPTQEAQCQAVKERYGAPEGYVLHFSSNNDLRDNTGIAIQAFKLASERLSPNKKLLIGGVNQLLSFGWGNLITGLGLQEKVCLIGFKTGNDLVELYQAADVYLDTSLFEGFGFQVAEALACGTPVVCSNNSSLPEVVGDAGIQVNATDVEGFAQAIAHVSSKDEVRKDFSIRGVRRVRRFSWEQCVHELTALMQKL